MNSIIIYLLSFIGIKPIEEEESKEILLEQEHLKLNHVENWLNQLSKLTVCRVLMSAFMDHPQLFQEVHTINPESALDKLKSIQSQVVKIAHKLDHQRPSEQFARASEVSDLLKSLIKSLHINLDDQSFVSLFSLLILTKEILLSPSEVRQHLFYHNKFGRIIILELSTLLKNFRFQPTHNHWSLIYPLHDDWFQTLQDICLKLSRYDITWEYRKEYQDVIRMAEPYYHQQMKSY